MEICLVVMQYLLVRPELVYTVFKTVNSIQQKLHKNIYKQYKRTFRPTMSVADVAFVNTQGGVLFSGTGSRRVSVGMFVLSKSFFM